MLMLTPISDKLILRDRSDNATDPKMRVADNVYELYRLGGAVSALSKKLSDKQPYQITFTDIYFEVNALQPLLAIVIEDQFIPLDTCKGNAVTLKNTLDSISRAFLNKWQKTKDDKDRTVLWGETAPVQDTYALAENIRAFEHVFSAELGRASLYFVEQVCAFRTETLIDRADEVFPANIRKMLPFDAIVDIKSAGRCLAFDLPTAAGFHTARAVETVLLQYFKELEIELPASKNLGRYIEALDKKAAEKGIDAKVIAAVGQFKDLYRNPIMHPDVTLKPEEAQILFALAQSAISAIILDIAKIIATPKEAPLPTFEELMKEPVESET